MQSLAHPLAMLAARTLPRWARRPFALLRAASRSGPRHESPFQRLLRHEADRAHLAELDDHILRDLGLTPAAVRPPEPPQAAWR